MEERNITISLKKARQWYQQGGDLKQVALQAFSKDELNVKFPTSWNEYNRNVNCKDYRVDAGHIIGSADYCHFATKEEAEAFVAFGKLIQLRDEYWKIDGNWKPDWTCYDSKYTIMAESNKIMSDAFCTRYSRVLSFRTKALRDMFYENFKNLIEEAKMFL